MTEYGDSKIGEIKGRTALCNFARITTCQKGPSAEHAQKIDHLPKKICDFFIK